MNQKLKNQIIESLDCILINSFVTKHIKSFPCTKELIPINYFEVNLSEQEEQEIKSIKQNLEKI
jgi:hypothetical protein